MEYIEYEYNFGEFREFLEDHEGVLYDDDYIHFITIALKHKNIKVIKYIINNDLIDIKLWNNYIALLFEFEMKECLQLLLQKNADINSKNEENTLLDYAVINIVSKPEDIDEKIKYILYIIDNGGKCDVNTFCKYIGDNFITEDNMNYVVYTVDLLIIFNLVNVKIKDDNEELKLLFSNMNKNCNEILKQLDDKLLQIMYNYYNVTNTNELFLCINKLEVKKKSGWSDDELFIYYDGTNNWCFSNQDVKYIKKTKMNPLNDSNIPDYVIKLM